MIAPPERGRGIGCRRATRPRFGPTGIGAVRRAHSSDAAHDPRVPEVVAHQPLDALPRLVARIAEHVRGALLQLVAEHVLIALRLEVQDRADAQQKVLGVVEPTRVGGTALQQQRIGQHRDRPRRHQIAKRARRLLHVGLELIQRLVESRVPLLDQREQRLKNVGVRRGRVEHRREPVEERARAANEPGIEQRQQEFRVVRLEIREFVELAHLVTDHHPEIPERMQKRAKEALLGRPDAAFEEQQ